ncbi:MAG: chemotaxis protein CheC [Deltaproteobacteria bacterium]
MNTSQTGDIFSKDDAAILEEVMNLAFGKASADLAEVIDIRILLNVPRVEIMKADRLFLRIKEETKEYGSVSIIEQNFWGKYTGSAILAFPSTAGKGLLSLFDDDVNVGEEEAPLLEKESLLEVGNILIGACVSKVAELLEDIVSFSPPRLLPRVVINNLSSETISPKLDDPGKSAILIKTVFHFEDKDIKGFLFLIANQNSMG